MPTDANTATSVSGVAVLDRQAEPSKADVIALTDPPHVLDRLGMNGLLVEEEHIERQTPAFESGQTEFAVKLIGM